MLPADVRRTILRALFADQCLRDVLVLKGGNALSLVYGVGGRTSLDLDFSIAGDLDSPETIGSLMERSLVHEFRERRIAVFDFTFRRKPSAPTSRRWGGYLAEFKLIPVDHVAALGNDLSRMQRQALTVSAGSQRRIYRVEISKYEFVGDAEVRQLDDVDIRVYSPVLLASEKLRALVQQHPQYSLISAQLKRSRSRDLYDIWAICDYFALKLEKHYETIQAVFAAKEVDMGLLDRFSELQALHSADWADVENSVAGELESVEYYFEFVRTIAEKLYAEWVVDTP